MNLFYQNPWLYGFLAVLVLCLTLVVMRFLDYLEDRDRQDREFAKAWHDQEDPGFPILTEEIPPNTPLDNTARPQ